VHGDVHLLGISELMPQGIGVQHGSKPHNGYVIVWKLLCHYVPGFNPAKTIDKPCWEDYNGNVIHYAVGFNLYFRLCAKRLNCHSQYHRLILFLQGITAHHLMKVVEPLLITVKSQQPDEIKATSWVSYLPPHHCIDELAQKLAEHSKVDPYDRDLGGRPRINYTGHGTPTHIALTQMTMMTTPSPLMPSPS
jgi:hypothetical protein